MQSKIIYGGSQNDAAAYINKTTGHVVRVYQDVYAPMPEFETKIVTFLRNWSSPVKDHKMSMTDDIADRFDLTSWRSLKELDDEINDAGWYFVPVQKYEHTGISYSIGTGQYAGPHFDVGIAGYAYAPISQYETQDDFEEAVMHDLELLTSWSNGEVYIVDYESDEICECYIDPSSLKQVLSCITALDLGDESGWTAAKVKQAAVYYC